MGEGIVGVTLCPGKHGDSVFGDGWERDLATDVAAIRDWDASAVVTLIEDHEFEMLGVESLPDAIRGAGFEWHHLPVKDVSPPDQVFETRWVYAGARLRERLRRGERVLVHCRGGLGRAGSVAARLLVEFGAEPGEAIRQVRAVRPGAIETREQERWVEAQRAVTRRRCAPLAASWRVYSVVRSVMHSGTGWSSIRWPRSDGSTGQRGCGSRGASGIARRIRRHPDVALHARGSAASGKGRHAAR